MRRTLLVALVAAVVFCGVAVLRVDGASAHRHGCHPAHTCPSDHATYRWRGMLCVKPTSDKRNATFRKRVVHAGLTYYCKR